MATLAGGCFWCLEAVYEQLEGVTHVASGYTGGTVAHPSYEQVCAGTTGHAEAVRIAYDPQVISLGELLAVFFDLHDPTTLNRQGADVGTQHRSAMYTHDEPQQQGPALLSRGDRARGDKVRKAVFDPAQNLALGR